MSEAIITTERLWLRTWREEDRAPFAALNADAEVMRYFPHTLEAEQSNASVDRFEEWQRVFGFCPWAVERREDGAFVGFVGLLPLTVDLPDAEGVEVGWRLAKPYWGWGYASEAARASLEFAFERLDLEEIWAITAAVNVPSRRVMERVGMVYDPTRDFEHPRIEPGSPLRSHVTYRSARG